MDDADMIRIARGIDELDYPKFTGHNMTPTTELQRRLDARVHAIRTYFTEEGEGIGARIGESLKLYFTTDAPEEPRKPNAAARRARQATATLLVKAANRIAPKEE